MSNPPAFGSSFSFGATNATNNTSTNASTQPSPFGAAPATTGNIFGGGTTGSNIFGGGAAATTPAGGNQPPKPSIFGGFGTTSTPSVTTPAAAAGATGAPTGGLFNGGAGFGMTGPSLFGNLGNNAPGKPAGTGLFGAPLAGTTPAPNNIFGGGNLFGAKPAAATPAAATPTAQAPAFGGGLFGNSAKPADPAASSSNAAAPGPSLFGGFGQPAPTSTATTGGLFGSSPSAPAADKAGAPAAPAFQNLFAPKDAAGAPKTDPTAQAPATTGSFGLGGQAASSGEKGKEPARDSAEVPAPPASTNLFGGLGLGKPSGAADAGAGAAKPPPFNLFGNAAADAQGKEAAKPAAPLFGPGATAPSLPGTLNAPATIGGTKPTSSAPAETGATAPTTTAANDKPAPPLIPPSILKGKTMEDIVNQWSTDLEAQAKEFQRLAGEVQVWDKVLTDNGRQISNVYAMVLQAEKTQADVEASLDQIEDQQKQLSDALDGYERATDDILQSQGMRGMDVGPADAERDKNYTLATSLNTQLDELARSLSAMIDEVNSVTASGHSSSIKPVDNTKTLGSSNPEKRDVLDEDSDPMAQIQGILNAHLESLSWINGTVKELEGKVVGLEKKFGNALPENPALDRTQGPGSLGRSGTRGLMTQKTVLEGSMLGGSRYGTPSAYGFRR